jgi:DNA-binding NtrC family response regulator
MFLMQKKTRVLIVDDEVDFSEVLAERLVGRNIEAVTADGCLMALEKLKAGEIDVIIMDISMPGIDGIECLARVKGQWPATEIIILTGHASVATGIEGMKGGAFDYCLKPIDFEELLEKIELACEKGQISRGR